MKTRTNQPVYKDNGEVLKDSDVLPSIASGDAGKVLMVNEDEDGYELGTASGGTNLYQHIIYDNNYMFVFYTNSGERLDSHSYESLSELYEEMLSLDIIAIYYSDVDTYFLPCFFNDGSLYYGYFDNGLNYLEVDDFSYTNFTDTVTKL